MPVLPAKDLHRQVINELINLYEEREVNTLARNYLQDRFHCDAIKLGMNAPVAYDESLLAKDLQLLRAAMPLQYVVGFTQFMGHRFRCTKAALIPRPETEELVAWIIDLLQGQPEPNLKILDIGTGTGCIPISLQLACPQIEAVGMDIAPEAIALAYENAKTLQAKVNFTQADVLSDPLGAGWDLIVSNPPYIPVKEKASMHQNVLAYEPEQALFVPNEDPLLFYRAIAQKAKVALGPKGYLFFEVHESFSEAVVKLLKREGFRQVALREDFQGKDRMLRAERGE